MQVCEILHDMCTWNTMSVTWVVHHVGGTSVCVTIVTACMESNPQMQNQHMAKAHAEYLMYQM